MSVCRPAKGPGRRYLPPVGEKKRRAGWLVSRPIPMQDPFQIIGLRASCTHLAWQALLIHVRLLLSVAPSVPFGVLHVAAIAPLDPATMFVHLV